MGAGPRRAWAISNGSASDAHVPEAPMLLLPAVLLEAAQTLLRHRR